MPPQVATAITRRTDGGQPQVVASTGSAAGDEIAGTAAQMRAAGNNGSNKQAKARQNMAGVESGDSRVAKSRGTSDLSVETPK